MTEMQINYRNLQETRRHNKATEELTGEQIAETRRSNIAREAETYRSNVAALAETQRSNMANEAIRRQTNAINQSHYERQDAETVQHNRNVELETSEHNMITEIETNRHNVVSEDQNKRALDNTVRRTTSQIEYDRALTAKADADRFLARANTRKSSAEAQSKETSNKFQPWNEVMNSGRQFFNVIDSALETISNGLNLFGRVRQTK